MILGCPTCGTRFRIDDARIRADGVKVRCSRCAAVFVARPDDAEVEGTPDDPETRRVDASQLAELARESRLPESVSTPAAESSLPDGGSTVELTSELDLGGTSELFSGSAADLSPYGSAGGHTPRADLDDLADLFQADDDVFSRLDESHPGFSASEDFGASQNLALSSGPHLRYDLAEDAATNASAPSRALLEELRDPSVDLPNSDATGLSFLDSHPSSGGFLLPSVDTHSSGELLLDDRGYQGGLGYVPSELGAADEDTRVAVAIELPVASTVLPAARLEPSTWPTWLGLALGGLICVTLVPGWAPAPLDRIAPEAADFLYPAARPRLARAVPQVKATEVEAFPYRVDDEQIVIVVRGRASNRGDAELAGIRATVLVLDGDAEVERASAPLGVEPTPFELVDWLAKGPPSGGGTLAPGEELPFVVIIPSSGVQPAGRRFRVELEGVEGDSARDRPRKSS